MYRNTDMQDASAANPAKFSILTTGAERKKKERKNTPLGVD